MWAFRDGLEATDENETKIKTNVPIFRIHFLKYVFRVGTVQFTLVVPPVEIRENQQHTINLLIGASCTYLGKVCCPSIFPV